ncbi:hypothetical protein ACWT_2804 [Actinoplanes sp. SE50]|uniref:DUF2306 domain-containing protein n=1 Tax=unclassified Actinoplanes TaxID=2626549 RepID=UPI00023EC5DB|nr:MULTISPECIES: DUF2306 domain-containing protein [unclassified Actinoplanes]AEV83637.1 hypothetical protein ACPL_2742 [Actinoplanes sp. SE50/110]ATO82219.1 hypothetical protein ACWT_2804 [Actinoplanes sp. SE50]SLL99626.1 DUF2306 domain-containing protein [Actinoplanes sp. SE50/110]
MPHRRTTLLLPAAIIFGLVLALPYLSLDPARSRIPVPGDLPYAVLVAHILTATVALVIGPLQFARRIRAHRTLGRIYLLAGVLPAAVTAIPVALWFGRPLTRVSLVTAAILIRRTPTPRTGSPR